MSYLTNAATSPTVTLRWHPLLRAYVSSTQFPQPVLDKAWESYHRNRNL